MNLFTVAFAGSTMTLNCETAGARELLTLLFVDVTHQTGEDKHTHLLSLLYHKGQNEYQLRDGDSLLFRGHLGVQFTAYTYDTVIYHLLNRSGEGIALHAGGVICNDRVIILPDCRRDAKTECEPISRPDPVLS